MKKILTVIFAVGLFVLGAQVPAAVADEGTHFHCSVCGAHGHGSMWHDSDKDGTNDR